MTPTGAVLVMAKAPRLGTGKTRLAPVLGAQRRVLLQEELIRHTTALATGCERTYLACSPAEELAAVRGLVPFGVEIFGQRGQDLGQRLAAAVEEVFARRAGPLIVVGTDAPTLTRGHLRQAFALLDADVEVVLGPAVDGGYYLIGMRRPHSRLFGLEADRWGGPEVLAATLAIVERDGLRVEMLPRLRDLDTPADAVALLADPLLPAEIAAVLQPDDFPTATQGRPR